MAHACWSARAYGADSVAPAGLGSHAEFVIVRVCWRARAYGADSVSPCGLGFPAVLSVSVRACLLECPGLWCRQCGSNRACVSFSRVFWGACLEASFGGGACGGVVVHPPFFARFASWRPSEASWWHLGGSLGPLDASWRLLGRSRWLFGGPLRPLCGSLVVSLSSWRQLGGRGRWKTGSLAETSHKFCGISIRSWEQLLCSIWVPLRPPGAS